jgi:hypothetical protein
MDENVIQYVKKDKELQKHIMKMHLKSDNMFASFYILGILLFIEFFLVFVFPLILIPIIIVEILIETYLIFKKNYTLEEYEVKEVYDNIRSKKLKYYECILAKPGNKKIDGFLSGNIIKSRNEQISVGDKVIAIIVGKEVLVTKYNG